MKPKLILKPKINQYSNISMVTAQRALVGTLSDLPLLRRKIDLLDIRGYMPLPDDFGTGNTLYDFLRKSTYM